MIVNEKSTKIPPNLKEVREYFLRHMVSIGVDVYKDEELLTEVFSGFLYSTDHLVLLVFSGHCAEYLLEIAESSELKSKTYYLFDADSEDSKYKDTIPLNIEDIRKTQFLNEGVYDFAVMPLREYYCRLLKSNNKTTITKNFWNDDYQSYDYYYLAGIPHKSIKNRSNTVTISYKIKQFILADFRPIEFSKEQEGKIFGHLIDKELASEIKGMSGGPLFGVKYQDINEEEYSYEFKLIGIQSSATDKGDISATKFNLIGRRLEQIDTEVYKS
jgi:hypothetical protein